MQGVVLCSVAFLFGLEAPFWGVVLGIVTGALLAAAFASASYAIALTLKSEDALAPLMNGIALPLLLLSGILLPITAATAPAWLNTLSNLNPIKHVVSGIRAQFDGDFGTPTAVWGVGDHDRRWRRSGCGSARGPSSARTAEPRRATRRADLQARGRLSPPRKAALARGAALLRRAHSTPSSTSTARAKNASTGGLGVGVAALAAAERRRAHLGGRERRPGVEVGDQAVAQLVDVGGLVALLAPLRRRRTGRRRAGRAGRRACAPAR